MSSTPLSRRAILAGAASVPALAVPAIAAVPVAELASPQHDAELIALGEKLKVAWANANRLKPAQRLYSECWQAATAADQFDEAAFESTAQKNGYNDASKKGMLPPILCGR
jgi:hypothetical protein